MSKPHRNLRAHPRGRRLPGIGPGQPRFEKATPGATFPIGQLPSVRVFKTKGFGRLARRRGISDAELCWAIRELMRGRGESLGGGVWKKRLGQNRQRSIILAEGGVRWVFEFLFAKQDRANINDAELAAFRKLAALYAALDDATIAALLTNRHWTEICDGTQSEVRE